MKLPGGFTFTPTGNPFTATPFPFCTQGIVNGNTGIAAHSLLFAAATIAGQTLVIVTQHASSVTVTSVPGYTQLVAYTSGGNTIEVWTRTATATGADSSTVTFSGTTGALNMSAAFAFAGAQLPTLYAGGAAAAYVAQTPAIAAPANALVLGVFSPAAANQAFPMPGWSSANVSASAFSLQLVSVVTSQAQQVAAAVSWGAGTGACLIVVIPHA